MVINAKDGLTSSIGYAWENRLQHIFVVCPKSHFNRHAASGAVGGTFRHSDYEIADSAADAIASNSSSENWL